MFNKNILNKSYLKFLIWKCVHIIYIWKNIQIILFSTQKL